MNEQLIKHLETLKPAFIEGLNESLFIYTTIGYGTYESPMWLQLNGFEHNKDVRFSNSQKTALSFTIPCDKITKELIKLYHEESYDFFKYVKYMHIKQFAPTVFDELAKGTHGQRINEFLNNYETI